jgi:adenosylcobyric acid synthase
VLLVGDIDRGGIFPQLLGTLSLLDETDRRLVRGLIVNKFRGDRALFADGVRILEERGGVPVLGVVPYLPALAVPEEDAVALDAVHHVPPRTGTDIAVIQLPHIANFDDFDPLRAEPNVHVRYVRSAAELGRPRAVIVPGTKSTMADLLWLRDQGLSEGIRKLAAEGAAVVGICGGYQMLGRVIRDPDRLESSNLAEIGGLSLLPIETTFEPIKETHQIRARVLAGPAWLAALTGQELTGYEIHMGRTRGTAPWLAIIERGGEMIRDADGASAAHGRIWGCYLHGLFANSIFRRAWLATLGHTTAAVEDSADPIESSLDRLADAVEAALNMKRFAEIIGPFSHG